MPEAHLPVVDAFIVGDYPRLRRLCGEVASDHPLFKYYRAIGEAVEAISNSRRSNFAYDCLRLALHPPPDDPELFLVLLRFSIDVTLRLGKVTDAQRSLQLIRQIDDPNIRRELKLGVDLLNESAIYYFLGDYEKAVRLLDECLALGMAPGSRMWGRIKTNRALAAIRSGRYTLARQDVADLSAFPKLDNQFGISMPWIKAYLCLQIGQFEQGLAELDAGRLDAPRHAQSVQVRIRLLLLAGRVNEARTILEREAQSTEKVLTELEYDSLLALESLLKWDIPETRRLARQAIAKAGQSEPTVLWNPLLLLMEAELNSRNALIARQILKTIGLEESKRQFTMYWVRLYLLEGKIDRAGELFKKLVDFENPELIQEGLRFASEVRAPDLAKLWTMSENKPRVAAAQSGRLTALTNPDDVFFVGSAPGIIEVKSKIAKFANADMTVLVSGETGTGKEVVARLLHQQSGRASKPFIAVNCGAISDTLIESELFGHVKGAFTGAVHDHAGLFVAAGEGTLFLDEIDAMSPHMQASLLRVLENREVRPLGSVKTRQVYARVIVASNQSLERAIQVRSFRQDLYYRLARLQIQLPPLRERIPDIPLLVDYFLQRIYGTRPVQVSTELLSALKRHSWPGNVRELKNAVELITLLAGDAQVLTADHFVPDLRFQPHASVTNQPAVQMPTPPTLSDPVSSRIPEPAASPAGSGSAIPVVKGTVPIPNGRYAQARLSSLRQLFREQRKLTRAEVVRQLDCAIETAQRDLEVLESEGTIRRVCNTASLRTSYFIFCGT
jgi:DNA-binding NtrC family response regulator/tetratricopeptide (TPR) repeat protein